MGVAVKSVKCIVPSEKQFSVSAGIFILHDLIDSSMIGWLVDNMTPPMTLYLFSLNVGVNIPTIQQTYNSNLNEASIIIHLALIYF